MRLIGCRPPRPAAAALIAAFSVTPENQREVSADVVVGFVGDRRARPALSLRYIGPWPRCGTAAMKATQTPRRHLVSRLASGHLNRFYSRHASPTNLNNSDGACASCAVQFFSYSSVFSSSAPVSSQP